MPPQPATAQTRQWACPPAHDGHPVHPDPHGPAALAEHLDNDHAQAFAHQPSWGFLDELHWLVHVPTNVGHVHPAPQGRQPNS